ncbi:MAG: sulfite exporter TauE/SafE family protein [Hyphomonas sp.]|uniref:TSUP family transporter n=1 Tax=Hyphomonas sp. TaxID=87 RepID=UPI00349FDF32
MSSVSALVILVTVLVTAFISGIFGMAGGLILMGVLAAMLPVASAMVVHGAVQMVSNGYRAFLWRKYIDWRVLRRYALGAIAGFLLLLAISWRPEARAVYLFLAATAMLVWLPKSWIRLDILKRGQAELAGFAVQALNTLGGVAGPLLDIFFVTTDLDRRAVVATKSVTQVLAHLVKVIFWSVPGIAAVGGAAFAPLWFFALAIPLSMLGTRLGGKLLEGMSDVDFKRAMKWLVTAIGAAMLLKASGWL